MMTKKRREPLQTAIETEKQSFKRNVKETTKIYKRREK